MSNIPEVPTLCFIYPFSRKLVGFLRFQLQQKALYSKPIPYLRRTVPVGWFRSAGQHCG